MTPLREMRRNEAFRGLNLEEAKKVQNYLHYRAPLLRKNIDLNKRKEGIYYDDFLDNAAEDLPVGHWSVQTDTLGSVAVLRSKLWPGYYFFHKANSEIYGGLYVGNGCKSLDVAFMF
jgi:radial spoke head protein 9